MTEIRVAGADDAAALARLVNTAYEVEQFFVDGDRTNAEDIRAEMAHGTFLLAASADGRVEGCIYVSTREAAGYFGMLAVAPDAQRRGLGRRLIAAAEHRLSAAGRDTVDILVVNLREDLIAFYERLGYTRTGTEPYVHRPVKQPCWFVRMEKRLA
jgi:ribosomal protein S18 acetylase RimI-like enzyme